MKHKITMEAHNILFTKGLNSSTNTNNQSPPATSTTGWMQKHKTDMGTPTSQTSSTVYTDANAPGPKEIDIGD